MEMKTEQILQSTDRVFNEVVIRQNHKTGFFCLTDAANAGGKVVGNWLKSPDTEGFIEEICRQEGKTRDEVLQVRMGRRNGGTWGHPLLLLDLAMWASPEFKYVALSWLKDKLLEHRDLAGDGFKEMSAALQEGFPSSRMFDYINEAKMVNEIVGVPCGERNTLSAEQLKLLGALQKYNCTLLRKKVGPREERKRKLLKAKEFIEMTQLIQDH
jgi:hypothetical protein